VATLTGREDRRRRDRRPAAPVCHRRDVPELPHRPRPHPKRLHDVRLRAARRRSRPTTPTTCSTPGTLSRPPCSHAFSRPRWGPGRVMPSRGSARKLALERPGRPRRTPSRSRATVQRALLGWPWRGVAQHRPWPYAQRWSRSESGRRAWIAAGRPRGVVSRRRDRILRSLRLRRPRAHAPIRVHAPAAASPGVQAQCRVHAIAAVSMEVFRGEVVLGIRPQWASAVGARALPSGRQANVSGTRRPGPSGCRGPTAILAVRRLREEGARKLLVAVVERV
jgi:hypothetical protein